MLKKTPYAFPILDVEEIVANANEMGGSLDAKSLHNPTYEVIWPVYETMAQYVLQLPRYVDVSPDNMSDADDLNYDLASVGKTAEEKLLDSLETLSLFFLGTIVLISS